MSQPFSRYLHPFDPSGPTYEPEVARALFASWERERRADRPRPCENGNPTR